MNDRAVSLLEQYDIEVLRTRKGRSAIVCDTNRGTMIFREYGGPKDKIAVQNELLKQIGEQCSIPVESVIPTKEQQLLTTDQDGVSYVLKTWYDGRECNIHDLMECKEAIRALAKLHLVMEHCPMPEELHVTTFHAKDEYERHNKELKKVRKFLKTKSQKNEFELYLQKNYDYFFEQAIEILEEWSCYMQPEDEEQYKEQGTFCHGDYQYHNIIKVDNSIHVINFEKCILDDPVRDLGLFLRKILEKANWSVELGKELIHTYSCIRPLSARSHIELYYRLAYPEKFWKIVNFYYNTGKAWIPEKNMEKLHKLLILEELKQTFLQEVFRTI